MKGFTRFVEPGRVALINYGEDYGKVVVIADIVDDHRVLIDGPTTGIERTMYPLSRVALTDFKLKGVQRGARTGTITKALKKDDVITRFNKTAWGQKLATRAKRASLNDFARFSVMVNQRRKSFILRKEAAKLRKSKK